MLLLGHVSGVPKDVLIEDLFLGFIVVNFSPFPGCEIISVKVLYTNKTCNSVC